MTTAADRRRYRALAVADTDAFMAKAREERARVIEVESRSRHGHFHEVRVALDGTLLCPCPAGMNGLNCWHLEEARRQMTTATKALTIKPVAIDRMALVPTTEMINGVRTAAKLALGGRVTLPAELDSEPKVMAVMMYGMELGLRPFTAMKHLYIVKGKVAPSAEVMTGLLMRSDPQARIIVEKLEVKGAGANMTGLCTLRLIRPSRQIDQRLSVDWEQIKRAGLARDNNLLYPEDRLRYHCTKRLMRICCPDVINALDDEGNPSIAELQAHYGIEGAPEELTPGGDASLYNDGDDEEPEAEWAEIPANVDSATGEVLASTDAQRKAVKELWPILLADKPRLAEIRAEYPRIFPQPGTGAVNSVNDLTFEEAKAILLKYCEHDAKVDENTTLLTCGKCGSVLEDGPPDADAVQAPALPI